MAVQASLRTIGEDQWQTEVAAGSIDWLPLGEGAYLHLRHPGAAEADAVIIDIVGVPSTGMAGLNVLLLT